MLDLVAYPDEETNKHIHYDTHISWLDLAGPAHWSYTLMKNKS